LSAALRNPGVSATVMGLTLDKDHSSALHHL